MGMDTVEAVVGETAAKEVTELEGVGDTAIPGIMGIAIVSTGMFRHSKGDE